MSLFSPARLTRSLHAAMRGLRVIVKEEHSFRLQLVAAAAVFVVIAVLDLAAWESVALAMMAVLVLVLELLNTVFERMIDMMKPRLSPYVGAIKDMLAGAVLVASIGAGVIGLFIIWPHVIS